MRPACVSPLFSMPGCRELVYRRGIGRALLIRSRGLSGERAVPSTFIATELTQPCDFIAARIQATEQDRLAASQDGHEERRHFDPGGSRDFVCWASAVARPRTGPPATIVRY